MLECGLYRLGSDFVEGHAVDWNAGTALLLRLGFAEFLVQVRGNGFAFPVRVGRQINRRRRLRLLLEVRQNLFFTGNNDVLGLKVVLEIDADLALRQIFDMTERGFDVVFLTEIFVDRFRLGGRLNDNQSFGQCSFP